MEKKKANLKNLTIQEVSFVDAGANQEANIKMTKRKSDGTETEPKENPVLKFFKTIAKKLDMSDEEADEVAESISKASTFSEQMAEMALRKIKSQIWDTCEALDCSLCSIMEDEEVIDKATMMSQSVDEFTETIKGLITSWSSGKPAAVMKSTEFSKDENAERLQDVSKRIEEILKACGSKEEKGCGGKEKKAAPKGTGETNSVKPDKPEGEEDPEGIPAAETGGKKPAKNKETTKAKGGDNEMKFDKSKMTPEELATFEALEKKYGTEDQTPETGTVEKKAESTEKPAEKETEDIYKGLNPAVAEELKSLRKRADEAETREFMDIAKKYQIIGKKPEELAPMLKNMKHTAPDAYDQMISIMDASVKMAENSGAFSEFGKRGTGETASAVEKVQKYAEDIQKAAPNMSHAEAVAKAWTAHPELVEEYENA